MQNCAIVNIVLLSQNLLENLVRNYYKNTVNATIFNVNF
jgi:hypothetical protein